MSNSPVNPDRNLGPTATAAFAAAAVVLVVNAFVAYGLTHDLREASGLVAHTVEVQLGREAILTALSDAESHQRAYLLTGTAEYGAKYDAAKARTAGRVDALENMVADNPPQAARVHELRVMIAGRVAGLDQNRDLGPKKWNPDVLADGDDRTDGIRDALAAIGAEEAGLLAARQGDVAASFRRAVGAFGLATLLALGGVGFGFVLVRGDVATRRRLAREQSLVAAMQQTVAEERERAAAEQERLAAYNTMLLNSSGEGIYGIDPDGNCTFVNAAALRMLNAPQDAVLGKNMHALVHHTRADGTAFPEDDCPIRRAVTAGANVRVEDDIFFRPDGSSFPVEFSAAPLKNAGKLEGAVVVFADITRRKKIDDDLRAAAAAADHANLAKSQFLANMSHELRTPLNAVILYSELLQEEAEDAGVARFVPDLEKIRVAGRHLLSLVNGVLDLSKIEAGKMDLYLEDFDVAKAVDEVLSTAKPLVEKSHNALKVEIDPAAGGVRADLTKVRQVLFNLISNAGKFTENGTITVAAVRGEVDGRDAVIFRVTDTGIGMTPEQLARLFRPFTQADESTTRKYGGTGLGLTISRRFAEIMGGSLTVESESGVGTTFTFVLPAKVVSPDATTSSAGVNLAVDGAALVIDDDPAARDMVARALAQEGVTAVTAADGEEGLRLAKHFTPSVVFLDVIMPKMDGWAVLAAFKADPRLADVPVVMLTLSPGQDLGYLLGAAEYVNKPVDRDRLLGLIRKYAPAGAETKILVVDDDPATREVVSRVLAREGWGITEAGNGRAALEKLDAGPYGLIILDLLMPEMDGFTFLTEFRRRDPSRTVPVVVMTSKDLTHDERAKLAGQVEAVVQKGSYGRDELLREVRALAKLYVPPAPAEPATEPVVL